MSVKTITPQSDAEGTYTAFFVVSNKQQIDMFLPLNRYLYNFKILYVYLADWGPKKCELENYLSSLNINHFTIGNLFITHQIATLFKRMPDIVVLGHDSSPRNQEIIQQAKKFEIPTLLIQDGMYAASNVYRITKKRFLGKLFKIPRMLLTKEYDSIEKIEILICSTKNMLSKKRMVGRGNYSKIAVFGEATKKLLENEGVDPKKIIVTGSPKFDCLYNYNSEENPARYQQLGISQNMKIVLLITQPFVESSIWTKLQWKEYISQIGILIENMGNCQLIIKIRQNRENISEYKKLSKFCGIHPIICGEINLPTLIKISDVVITVSSTGGLETIAAEKPLIIFDPFYTPGSSFYDSENIIFLRNTDELSMAIKKIVSNNLFRELLIQKQYSFLKENIFKNDGKASERIYNVIMDMVKNGLESAR